MGAEGEKWGTARIAVSSQERIKLLFDFPRFRRAIESMIEKAQNKAPGDPMTLAAALISKYRNGSGFAHFERLVRGAKEAYDWHAKKWKRRKICAGNISFDKFRAKLPRHFLDGAKIFVMEKYGSLLPQLEDLKNESGRVVGAMADIVQVTKCAAANALGCEKYQEHFILKEPPPLPVDHVWLLLGIGDDGLPFRTMQIDGMDQGALSISNLGGCAHATESMLAFFLASCDEKSAIADKVHQAQEVAYDWMKKSESPDPAAGIRIGISHVPSNAK